MSPRSLVISAGVIALGATAANATHALRRHIVHWFSVPAGRWAQSPSDVLGSWAVIAISATALTVAFTSIIVLLRRRKGAVPALVLATPFVLFLSMLPLYSYIRRGMPASWFVCPSERAAFAAPLSVLIALAAFAFLAKRRQHGVV